MANWNIWSTVLFGADTLLGFGNELNLIFCWALTGDGDRARADERDGDGDGDGDVEVPGGGDDGCPRSPRGRT